MSTRKQFPIVHPKGEEKKTLTAPLFFGTFAGRVHVEWNPQAEVTPMGQSPAFGDEEGNE